MRVLIIGGVATGMSAASKLRREDKNAEVVVFEMGWEVSYGACGLPFYISGENRHVDLLRIRSVAEFKDQGIDVRTRHRVEEVNSTEKTIMVKELETGREYRDRYDKLVIATGASPLKPPLEGADLENAFTLKTIHDAEEIRRVLMREEVRDVVIIGTGFIGMEMVEACVRLGKKVRAIELQDQIMPAYEYEIATELAEAMQEHGVAIHTGEQVLGLQGTKHVTSVSTENGVYPADFVLFAVGVRPNTDFIAGDEFEKMKNGALVVNSRMETSVADIYAGGDCSTVYHRILGKQVYLPLGTNANKQGRIIGENLVGKKKEFPGALGTSVLRVLDLQAGKTGISEREARTHNIPHKTVVVQANNHAPYYPNPQPIKVKLVYCPDTGKVLGASMVGREGVALRINTCAAMITAGMTVEEAGNLDLGYAPPFAQVWDVIHVAANLAKR